jgi:hypothetical protein
MVLFLISTLNDSNAHLDACYSNAHLDACCRFSTLLFTWPLNLMRVFCVFLELGKLGYCEVFSSFVERRPALFFQSSKVPSTGYSWMSCCSNFFGDQHWDVCICLWQLTGNLLVMAISIQVARLLAYCVLVGSLAELLFSFCMRSMLAFLQMVDAIIGKVISSMVIVLVLKVHCNT